MATNLALDPDLLDRVAQHRDEPDELVLVKSALAAANPALPLGGVEARLNSHDSPLEKVGYSNGMAPTIVRDGQFRLFVFSWEETRIHVHVSHLHGEAKFWLTPQVGLANHTGVSATQLRQA